MANELEGVIPAAANREKEPFSRKLLRKQTGPDRPFWQLLQKNIIQDVAYFEDDFFGVLNSDYWLAWNSSSATAFNASEDVVNGQLTGAFDNANDAWLNLHHSNEWLNTDHRPCAIIRWKGSQFDSDDDLIKVEWGFYSGTNASDEAGAAADAGLVLVKDTPTATPTDFAVICLDTDDNTYFDVVCDTASGTTATSNLSAANPAWDDNDDTWMTMMIALNEQDEAYAWINGQLLTQTSVTAPTAAIDLGLWFFVQAREAPGTPDFEIDYIAAWQEREAA